MCWRRSPEQFEMMQQARGRRRARVEAKINQEEPRAVEFDNRVFGGRVPHRSQMRNQFFSLIRSKNCRRLACIDYLDLPKRRRRWAGIRENQFVNDVQLPIRSRKWLCARGKRGNHYRRQLIGPRPCARSKQSKNQGEQGKRHPASFTHGRRLYSRAPGCTARPLRRASAADPQPRRCEAARRHQNKRKKTITDLRLAARPPR